MTRSELQELLGMLRCEVGSVGLAEAMTEVGCPCMACTEERTIWKQAYIAFAHLDAEAQSSGEDIARQILDLLRDNPSK